MVKTMQVVRVGFWVMWLVFVLMVMMSARVVFGQIGVAANPARFETIVPFTGQGDVMIQNPGMNSQIVSVLEPGHASSFQIEPKSTHRYKARESGYAVILSGDWPVFAWADVDGVLLPSATPNRSWTVTTSGSTGIAIANHTSYPVQVQAILPSGLRQSIDIKPESTQVFLLNEVGVAWFIGADPFALSAAYCYADRPCQAAPTGHLP